MNAFKNFTNYSKISKNYAKNIVKNAESYNKYKRREEKEERKKAFEKADELEQEEERVMKKKSKYRRRRGCKNLLGEVLCFY